MRAFAVFKSLGLKIGKLNTISLPVTFSRAKFKVNFLAFLMLPARG